MAHNKKEATGDAYNAVVLLMEKIVLDNYRVPFGRHHRNLKEDYEYFRILPLYYTLLFFKVDWLIDWLITEINAGIPVPEEIKDERHLRAIDTNYEARSFGAVTYSRIKREFNLSIEQSTFPWYEVVQDMVANYRSALNPHDNNLISWDIVVCLVIL